MKYLLLVMISIPLISQAQDCKILRETDPYTKETRLSSGFISLQGASLSVDADSKELDFFFTLPGKCFNDASTVYIYFAGSKSRSTYRNAGSMNCEGYFHFKYRNSAATTNVLKKLSTLKVDQFVFIGTDKKEMVVSLLPEQQEAMMKAVACVVDESKTLLK